MHVATAILIVHIRVAPVTGFKRPLRRASLAETGARDVSVFVRMQAYPKVKPERKVSKVKNYLDFHAISVSAGATTVSDACELLGLEPMLGSSDL